MRRTGRSRLQSYDQVETNDFTFEVHAKRRKISADAVEGDAELEVTKR